MVDCRLSLMPTPDCRLSLMPTIDVGSLVTGMCDPCSGHSTRDRDMVDGCSYGGHMIDDCSHDGHGHVGAPDDGSLLSFDDPDDVLDDVGGAHDDVALGDGFGALALDGGAPWSS